MLNKSSRILLMKFVNIETKTRYSKFFLNNKLINKQLFKFVATNYFKIHKLLNNEIIKQIYPEDSYYKIIILNRYGKIIYHQFFV